ncbi:MAG: ABC-type transporter Mla MlaB component [bacterium]|jgi:ABC-type transporter Mla MlaB component
MNSLKIVQEGNLFTLQGKLDIESAELLLEKLFPVFEIQNEMILNCERISEIDLSGIQLIYSIGLFAEKNQKTIQILDGDKKIVQKKVQFFGFPAISSVQLLQKEKHLDL